ncbi:hypothetical protein Gohar_017329, partial [Gossypium harknessii]|nr:hypothetical protein [Gossypium harknessii]
MKTLKTQIGYVITLTSGKEIRSATPLIEINSNNQLPIPPTGESIAELENIPKEQAHHETKTMKPSMEPIKLKFPPIPILRRLHKIAHLRGLSWKSRHQGVDVATTTPKVATPTTVPTNEEVKLPEDDITTPKSCCGNTEAVTPQNLGLEVLGLEQGNCEEFVYKSVSALVVKGLERSCKSLSGFKLCKEKFELVLDGIVEKIKEFKLGRVVADWGSLCMQISARSLFCVIFGNLRAFLGYYCCASFEFW